MDMLNLKIQVNYLLQQNVQSFKKLTTKKAVAVFRKRHILKAITATL